MSRNQTACKQAFQLTESTPTSKAPFTLNLNLNTNLNVYSHHELILERVKNQTSGGTQWFKQHLWRQRDALCFGSRQYIGNESLEGRLSTKKNQREGWYRSLEVINGIRWDWGCWNQMTKGEGRVLRQRLVSERLVIDWNRYQHAISSCG